MKNRSISITLSIDDLSCRGGGVLIVKQALARSPGVVYVYVNPTTEMAYIKYDPTLSDPKRLAQIVEQAGFRTGTMSVRSANPSLSLHKL